MCSTAQLQNNLIYDIYITRFLLIYYACFLSFVGKGLALSSPFGGGPPIEKMGLGMAENKTFEQKLLVIAITSATMFLHGLLLGIVSRWHRGILETFVAHPSIVLRPVFTHFTFASSTK